MRKRLTSLVLLLALTGSALAGVPLRFGESECSMDQPMDGMDCCRAALLAGESPEATAARLCCVVNCSHEGSAPPSCGFVTPRSQPAALNYQPNTPESPVAIVLTRRPSQSHGPPTDSHPAYIRHLALLI